MHYSSIKQMLLSKAMSLRGSLHCTLSLTLSPPLLSVHISLSISLQSIYPHIFLFCPLAFDGEHCWEPYMPHGNFSSSDITFQLGTVVTFACSPGFVMEQGSGSIECVDPSDPRWNESEPVCRGKLWFNFFILIISFQWFPFEKINTQGKSSPTQNTLPGKTGLIKKIRYIALVKGAICRIDWHLAKGEIRMLSLWLRLRFVILF